MRPDSRSLRDRPRATTGPWERVTASCNASGTREAPGQTERGAGAWPCRLSCGPPCHQGERATGARLWTGGGAAWRLCLHGLTQKAAQRLHPPPTEEFSHHRRRRGLPVARRRCKQLHAMASKRSCLPARDRRRHQSRRQASTRRSPLVYSPRRRGALGASRRLVPHPFDRGGRSSLRLRPRCIGMLPMERTCQRGILVGKIATLACCSRPESSPPVAHDMRNTTSVSSSAAARHRHDLRTRERSLEAAPSGGLGIASKGTQGKP